MHSYTRRVKRKKNPHAVALGREGGKKGGKKGGHARWKDVPTEERRELMRKAVQERWARAKAKEQDAERQPKSADAAESGASPSTNGSEDEESD